MESLRWYDVLAAMVLSDSLPDGQQACRLQLGAVHAIPNLLLYLCAGHGRRESERHDCLDFVLYVLFVCGGVLWCGAAAESDAVLLALLDVPTEPLYMDHGGHSRQRCGWCACRV